jgi:hypothetical protein
VKLHLLSSSRERARHPKNFNGQGGGQLKIAQDRGPRADTTSTVGERRGAEGGGGEGHDYSL